MNSIILDRGIESHCRHKKFLLNQSQLLKAKKNLLLCFIIALIQDSPKDFSLNLHSRVKVSIIQMECDKKGNETDLDVESDDERADIGVSGRRLIENDAGCGSATTPY